MRWWPRPSVVTSSADDQARATAAPCSQGTSRSPRSWITSSGWLISRATFSMRSSDQRAPIRRSIRRRARR
jgi:hypothetical protein